MNVTEKKERLSINVNKKTKEEAAKLYESMGMNLTTAVNAFLIQSVREQKMPFTPSLNSLSEQAKRQSEAGIVYEYSDSEEFKKYLDKLIKENE